MDFSFLVPYTIEMNKHNPCAGGTRDTFESGWVNDRAGPLTGLEVGNSELLDADGNSISSSSAVPANMRPMSSEVIPVGATDRPSRSSPGPAINDDVQQRKADFRRNKRLRKTQAEFSARATRASSGERVPGSCWKWSTTVGCTFRAIPGAEHLHRGMWPLPTVEQLANNLNPADNGGKGLFDFKTKEEGARRSGASSLP